MPLNLNQLPDNLPVPLDDGAADHLWGLTLPKISLQSTQGKLIPIGDIAGRVVLYCYQLRASLAYHCLMGGMRFPVLGAVRRKLVRFETIFKTCSPSAQR